MNIDSFSSSQEFFLHFGIWKNHSKTNHFSLILRTKNLVKFGTQQPQGHENLLGCCIDTTLKWNSQVTTLIPKLVKRLNSLMSLQKVCTFEMRKKLTEGLFNSVLIYCLPLYGGMNKQLCNQIQTVQNRAARFVCDAPPRSNRLEMFTKIGWLTVHQLIRYHTLISVYKIRHAKQPEYLSSILSKDSRNQRIIIPNYNLTIFHDSFCSRGANHWNQLPLQLRNASELGNFKKGLKKWILDNVEQFEV